MTFLGLSIVIVYLVEPTVLFALLHNIDVRDMDLFIAVYKFKKKNGKHSCF